jgi:hypothetical protein
MTKLTRLARALGILLAIVAGFVAIPGGLNIALVLVVLGLIAGSTMPKERFIFVALYALVLPVVGAALGNIPMIGAQLSAVAGGLALVAAGAVASAIAIEFYEQLKDGTIGLAK